MRGPRKLPSLTVPSAPAPPNQGVATKQQNPHPAVVRIVANEGNTTSLGSGTLIHVTQDFGLVITNWHVVRGAKGPVEVIFPDGFRSGGTVMKLDDSWDLAAVGIWRPKVAPVRLAGQAPVRAIGYRLPDMVEDAIGPRVVSVRSMWHPEKINLLKWWNFLPKPDRAIREGPYLMQTESLPGYY